MNRWPTWGASLGYDEIKPWDIGYLAEKQRLDLYEFDEEELRPYFELDRVVAGMFDIFSRVLGIKVIAEPEFPAGIPRSSITGWKTPAPANFWAASIPIGFHARISAAAPGWIRSSRATPAVDEPHIGLICGNLTPRSATRHPC